MKRRFIVEVELDPKQPGMILRLLCDIADTLEKAKEAGVILDSGIALEHDFTWFVKTAADLDKKLEEAEGKE